MRTDLRGALFFPRCRDVNIIQTLWSQIGTVTNHQTLFSPFDWGSFTITVSIVSFWFSEPSSVLISVEFSSFRFCLRPSSITSSCVACRTLHTTLPPRAITLWSSRPKRPTASFPSAFGRRILFEL